MSSISVQMYTLRDYMKTPDRAEDTLRRLAAIGYEWVQPIVPPFWTPGEYRRILDACGLKADSFSFQKPNPTDFIGEVLSGAEALGTTILRIGAISREAACRKEDFLRYAEGLDRQTRSLKDRGLTCIYHFHDYEFIDFDGETGVDLMLRTAPELHFQPDIHWIAAAGFEPSYALRKFTGRAEYVHMQGFAMLQDGQGQIKSATVPVGRGNLHWTGIVDTCREIGVRLYVVEQDNCQKDALESVEDSFRALRAMGID